MVRALGRILRVQLHPIKYHLPQSMDAVKVEVPDWAGTGHFVVHFDWPVVTGGERRGS